MKEISRLERASYFFAAAFIPCVPLFFLFNRNIAEGIQFGHTLMFGAALAVCSVMLYFILSLAFRARGAVLLFITLLWAAFWYISSLHRLLQRINGEMPLRTTASILLIVIAVAVVALAYIKLPNAAGSTAVVMICVLFAFNFFPAAFTALTARIALAASADAAPYSIKTSFNVDSDLPRPNIYWLHMDSMVGFSTFERYFNDPQDELKNTLQEYGFVINETAELEGGNTVITMPMLMSPSFFDHWLSPVIAKHAHLTRTKRHNKIMAHLRKQGVSLHEDIYPEMELLEAFSRAGYTISGNKDVIKRSYASNILNDGKTITVLNPSRGNEKKFFEKLGTFTELIVEASALKLFETSISTFVEEKTEPAKKEAQAIPAYENEVNKYKIENSQSSAKMAQEVRAAKYAAEMEPPHFFYFSDSIVHCKTYNTIGIGRVFDIDENGNLFKLKELKDDSSQNIFDLSRYYAAQYKYGVKQMLAKLEIIAENDPDALIIIQADHGIHGLGPPGTDYFNEKTFEEQGYTIEDMQNFNKNVLSAVRIPPQYGKLEQPLEPLDIARYLVNHYVGGDNYDYLAYQE